MVLVTRALPPGSLVPTGQPPGFVSDTVPYVRVQFHTACRTMADILTASPFCSPSLARAGEVLPDFPQNSPLDRCDTGLIVEPASRCDETTGSSHAMSTRCLRQVFSLAFALFIVQSLFSPRIDSRASGFILIIYLLYFPRD